MCLWLAISVFKKSSRELKLLAMNNSDSPCNVGGEKVMIASYKNTQLRFRH